MYASWYLYIIVIITNKIYDSGKVTLKCESEALFRAISEPHMLCCEICYVILLSNLSVIIVSDQAEIN